MSTDIIGSEIPADNGYGQNGDPSPSSTVPGQHISTGFLPKTSLVSGNWQTRSVSSEQIKAHPGMRDRTSVEAIPRKLNHR